MSTHPVYCTLLRGREERVITVGSQKGNSREDRGDLAGHREGKTSNSLGSDWYNQSL